MSPIDWVVLCGSLAAIVLYGMYKGRRSNTVKSYLLAGKTMPWYAMALSIMATQASAITFISTTGQSYVDGMRFVQFYFGLPLAMVILSATAVPIFHRAKVYTAYEYLEIRFDPKTRALVSGIFLIQRGLAVGLSLYAPAIVLTIVLGWSDNITTAIMGGLVVLYTVFGGIKAVTWTDVQQMLIIFAGLIAALITAVALLPADVSFLDAVKLAGAMGKLNAVETQFDLHDRYTLWSGLIGGMFLSLAYFGTDQSQVQRYLTGKSIGQSRLSLLFNGIAKVPMQFVILFIGAMVFVFFLFEKPPLLFNGVEMERVRTDTILYPALNERYSRAFEERRAAAGAFLAAERAGNPEQTVRSVEEYRRAQRELDNARAEGARLAVHLGGSPNSSDTNYIFLTFVTRYMPAGMVGLIMAAIFAATMSTTSAEINSLATVSIMDIYRRHIRKRAEDREYLWAARAATAFWGCYAIVFSQFGKGLGSLIEAVNIVGSLFYGGMLGVFVLAFFFRWVGGTAAFVGVIIGEVAIFYCHWFTGLAFLWYNVIGCITVIAVACLIQWFTPPAGAQVIPGQSPAGS